ncbi:proline/serine-rich coiled-coil protein 1 isoform X2 [Choloepus didactylus]|uniref:proline/serine-rich coiled-coil protein 1 isoform X1 n=1 Tax=Choloepus didactylus TaxID=27675 RepID=UPI00189F1B97|nr:proline/serine-rich coiled-coil protein 1 isoform X1 [Choloepus didactylus]XP_037671404.1 proline/serine-rich coiled-coil protein 1 isoform X2 [Choloepus didactylus]
MGRMETGGNLCFPSSSDLSCVTPAGGNMEDLEEDVKFIVDETLDFGGLSPSDSREEEDIAMLVTPEKPLRRGLSHRSDPNAVAPAPQALRISLGPLSPEKLEEILDEANRLATRLEQCALREREGTGQGPGLRQVKPSPRRETFVLKDSPVRDLLPTVSSLALSTSTPSSLTPRLRSSDRKGSVRALRATSGKRPSSVKRELPTCNLFPASKSPASPSPLARSSPSPLARSSPSPLARSSPSPLARSSPAPLARSSPSPLARSSPGPLARSSPAALARSSPTLLAQSSPSPLARSTPPIRGKAGPSGRKTAGPAAPVRPVLDPQPSTSNTQRLSRPQGAAAKPSSRLPIPSAIPRPASRMPLTGRSVPPGKGGLPPDSLSTRKGLPRPSAAGHRVPVSQRPRLPVTSATRSNLQPPRKVAVPGPTR